MTLSAENTEEALGSLFSELMQLGFQKKSQSGKYLVIRPEDKIGKTFPLAFSDKEIQKEMQKIPGWEIKKYNSDNSAEIEKTYEFKTFEDTIDFMQKVSEHISKVQHNTEWENLWKTLRVRFKTWDIGHKISYLDIELAEYFDIEFKKYYRKR